MKDYSEWIKISPNHEDIPIIGHVLEEIAINPANNPYLNISGFSVTWFEYMVWKKNMGTLHLKDIENKDLTLVVWIREDFENNYFYLLVSVEDEA